MVKTFFIKLVIIALFTVIPYVGINFWLSLKWDSMYWKTTEQADYLITGISRTKYAIAPQILQEELDLKSMPLNLGIDLMTSPYGKVYYEFIQKKMKTNTNRNIHIVCVTVGSLMDMDQENSMTRENKEMLNKLKVVNIHPNLEYIILHQNPIKLIVQIFKFRIQKSISAINHPNGWSETIMGQNFQRKENILTKKRILKDNPSREVYLRKIIDLLQTTGQVFLVRLPMDELMLQKENRVVPNFNAQIQQIADEKNVVYLDYSSNKEGYYTYDYSHLTGKEARRFTKKLAEDIRKYR